jgi:hypothetical protein
LRSSVGGGERVTGRRPMAAGRSSPAPLSRPFVYRRRLRWKSGSRALLLYSKVTFVRYFARIAVINRCNRVTVNKIGGESPPLLLVCVLVRRRSAGAPPARFQLRSRALPGEVLRRRCSAYSFIRFINIATFSLFILLILSAAEFTPLTLSSGGGGGGGG